LLPRNGRQRWPDCGFVVTEPPSEGGFRSPARERAGCGGTKLVCTAPGVLDTRLHYAARLRLVSRRAARASSGLR
jgi:hypothetical protein